MSLNINKYIEKTPDPESCMSASLLIYITIS